jgi:DNA-binding transcriptional regulator/RsmH inhibitor MraZ
MAYFGQTMVEVTNKERIRKPAAVQPILSDDRFEIVVQMKVDAGLLVSLGL